MIDYSRFPIERYSLIEYRRLHNTAQQDAYILKIVDPLTDKVNIFSSGNSPRPINEIDPLHERPELESIWIDYYMACRNLTGIAWRGCQHASQQ
jgi:hypothetical protein